MTLDMHSVLPLLWLKAIMYLEHVVVAIADELHEHLMVDVCAKASSQVKADLHALAFVSMAALLAELCFWLLK